MATSEASKKWYAKHGIEYQRQYRLNNADKRSRWNREWIAAHREQYNAAKYVYRDRVKIAVLEHYGNGKAACVWCGFDKVDALCLDHINDDGAEHRRNLKIAGRGCGPGMNTYEALKRSGLPYGLQVLCANCNLIKEMERKRKNRLQNQYYAERTRSL